MSSNTSCYISRKAATTLLHSARTAEATGRPFNIIVCISTWMLGIAPEDASEVFRRMRRQKFCRWSSYRPRGKNMAKNGAPADTWEFEAPDGRYHVHWMLHIRSEHREEFERKLARWVKAMAGLAAPEKLPDGALHVTTATNPEGAKLYMAKGIDPFYGTLWGIRLLDCGMVYGRRAGTARSLGPAIWKPLKRAYQARRKVRPAAY